MEMAPSNLQKYLKGERPVSLLLLRRLEELGCNSRWVLDDRKEEMYADNQAGMEVYLRVRDRAKIPTKEFKPKVKPKPEPEPAAEWISHQSLADHRGGKAGPMIPVYYPPANAGKPVYVADDSQTWYSVEQQIFRSPETLFAVRARGDSMCYDGIRDNDILIINRSLAAIPGKIVIAAWDGGIIVKRLGMKKGKLYLYSADGESPEIEVKQLDDLRIWGVVTSWIHEA